MHASHLASGSIIAVPALLILLVYLKNLASDGPVSLGPWIFSLLSLCPIALNIVAFSTHEPTFSDFVVWSAWWLVPAAIIFVFFSIDHLDTERVRSTGWVGGKLVDVTSDVPTGRIIRGDSGLAAKIASVWVIGFPYLYALSLIWQGDVALTGYHNLDGLVIGAGLPVLIGLIVCGILYDMTDRNHPAYTSLRELWGLGALVSGASIVFKLIVMFGGWLFT